MRDSYMKKNILIFILIFALGIMSGCGKTEVNKPVEVLGNTNQETELNSTPSTEVDEKNTDKSILQAKAPNPNLLDGQWILATTEVEGEKLTAEESGLKSEITIANDTAQYFITTEYETKRFEANLEFLEEPLYYDCSNDIWCLKFDTFISDFGEDEEFYATLIDENTLLLRHLFPFDGTQGVSHQTYTRK